MEETLTPTKRKEPEKEEEEEEKKEERAEIVGALQKQESALKKRNLTRTCVHEVVVPSGYVVNKDETLCIMGRWRKVINLSLTLFRRCL